jgi:uncharacterized protein YqgC (DUF456 family)
VYPVEFTHALANLIFLALLFLGVLLTMLGFSGNVAIMLVAIAYGFYDRFDHVDCAVLVILFAIFLLGEVADFLCGFWGARKVRASKRTMFAAMVGAAAGGIWGTLLLPVVGSLLGAFAGSFAASLLAEYSKTGDWERAQRVAAAVVKGQAVGTMIKVVVAVIMVITLICQLHW